MQGTVNKAQDWVLRNQHLELGKGKVQQDSDVETKGQEET